MNTVQKGPITTFSVFNSQFHDKNDNIVKIAPNAECSCMFFFKKIDTDL